MRLPSDLDGDTQDTAVRVPIQEPMPEEQQGGRTRNIR